jgi:hypothetical protein
MQTHSQTLQSIFVFESAENMHETLKQYKSISLKNHPWPWGLANEKV